MNIIQSPSPNFSPSSHKKIGLQIHKTLGLMPGTLEWLRMSPEERKRRTGVKSYSSAHLLFERNGNTHQLVQFTDRSWSAGRFNRPSERGKAIMKKDWLGRWVKPGHYLVQAEFECLSNQTFTEKQYEAIVWVCKNAFKTQLDLVIDHTNILEHQDTAIDKPELDPERAEILRRLEDVVLPPNEDKEVIRKEIHRLVDKL